MFKQIALLLTLALFASCACTSQYTPDAEAREASRTLSQTVKVFVNVDLVVAIPGQPEVKKDVGGGSGSGVVIAMENHAMVTYSLIATAKHVCDMHPDVPIPEEMKDLVRFQGTYSIQTIDGTVIPAKVAFVSPKADLCFLSVVGVVSPVASIAQFMPPLGSRVTSTGAPKGLWGHNLGVTTEGRYSGIDTNTFPEPLIVIGGVAAPGASGGPIWCHGELIGILIATATPGGYLVLGVPMLIVRAELADAMVIWRK